MASDLKWISTHQATAIPARPSDRSLNSVRFRLNPSAPLVAEDTFFIESTSEWNRIQPEVLLAIDQNALRTDTARRPGDVSVVVVARDRDLHKFGVISTIRGDALPTDTLSLGSDIRQNYSRPASLDVSVLIVGQGQETHPVGNCEHGSSILALRTFRVRARSNTMDIPVRVVEPETMVEHGADSRTAMFIRWKGHDLNRPPSDLLEVLLNRSHEAQYLALGSQRPGSAGDHIGRDLAAKVVTVILARVLNDDDEQAVEADSLTQAIDDLAQRALRLSLDHLRERYRDDTDKHALLLSWAALMVGSDDSFRRMRL